MRSERARPLIAVIDDEAHVVRLVAVNLEAAGYDTVSAGDGEAGLALVREHRPDLVVLDRLMPRMSGDQLLCVMRFDAELLSLPVIVLSVLPADDVREAPFSEWAQAYLRKPFNPFVLILTVRNLLGVPLELAADLAEVRRLRADPTARPAAFVAFLHRDPQLTYEASRALTERGEAALDALVAAGLWGDVAALGTPAALEALVGVLEDPEPLVRLQRLVEISRFRGSRASEVVFGRGPAIIDQVLAATLPDNEGRRRWVVYLLGQLRGAAGQRALATVAERDWGGQGAYAAELAESRSQQPR